MRREEGPAAKTLLEVATEDPEIEHVAEHVQPTAVKEHVREERHECLQGDVPVRDRAGELTPVERVAVVERFERGRLPDERERVDPDGDVDRQEQAVDHRRPCRGVGVAERDQTRSSVATTLAPWMVKIVREPSET